MLWEWGWRGGVVAKRRLHLTFREELVREPVIWSVGKRFPVVTNIRRANVEDRTGWVILELEGEEQAIEGAVGYLRDMGVQVDTIPEVVEG